MKLRLRGALRRQKHDRTEENNILLVEETEEHALPGQAGPKRWDAKTPALLGYKYEEEALDFLFNGAGYADEKEYLKPDVILLDLRLPKVSGIEVLNG